MKSQRISKNDQFVKGRRNFKCRHHTRQISVFQRVEADSNIGSDWFGSIQSYCFHQSQGKFFRSYEKNGKTITNSSTLLTVFSRIF